MHIDPEGDDDAMAALLDAVLRHREYMDNGYHGLERLQTILALNRIADALGCEFPTLVGGNRDGHDD
jgi:hypothetical protein